MKDLQLLITQFFQGWTRSGSESQGYTTGIGIISENPTQELHVLYNPAVVSRGHSPIAFYNPIRKIAVLVVGSQEERMLDETLTDMGFYQTGNTGSHRLYCPIACEDCIMQFACAVASEEDRLATAHPEALERLDEGPLEF